MAQNPTRQVHALLGGFVQDALINNQNHDHKCLGKLDNQLTRLLHELCSLARAKNSTCVSTGSTTAKTLAEKRLYQISQDTNFGKPDFA
jgi:hypothetical protein